MIRFKLVVLAPMEFCPINLQPEHINNSSTPPIWVAVGLPWPGPCAAPATTTPSPPGSHPASGPHSAFPSGHSECQGEPLPTLWDCSREVLLCWRGKTSLPLGYAIPGRWPRAAPENPAESIQAWWLTRFGAELRRICSSHNSMVSRVLELPEFPHSVFPVAYCPYTTLSLGYTGECSVLPMLWALCGRQSRLLLLSGTHLHWLTDLLPQWPTQILFSTSWLNSSLLIIMNDYAVTTKHFSLGIGQQFLI